MSEQQGLEIQVRDDVIVATGSIDAATAPALQAAITAARESETRVVIDLAGIEFMDSSGLSVLVASNGSDVAGEIVLRDPSRAVTKVLQITGLEERFTIG